MVPIVISTAQFMRLLRSPARPVRCTFKTDFAFSPWKQVTDPIYEHIGESDWHQGLEDPEVEHGPEVVPLRYAAPLVEK